MIQHYPFTLLPLPYLYDSLEPAIDVETLFFHHSKHLRTYVENLNKLLQPYPQFHDWSLEQLLRNPQKLPEEIREGIQKNAGGIYNHQLYFAGMTPTQTLLTGKLKEAILLDFKNWKNFYSTFHRMAMDIFGSGYLWLAADERGKLVLVPLPNQDTPLPRNLAPILNLDVWEHAYYLKHRNLRSNYIRTWFQVVNWIEAERRYQNALLDIALKNSGLR